MITVDEKKLDKYFQEYLRTVAENPEIRHNLKSLAPADWMSTSLISCVFASLIEKHLTEIVSFSNFKPSDFEKVKDEQELP